MFKSIPVEISNRYDFSIESHPFSIGVPCPEGAILDQTRLRLCLKGKPEPFYVASLASWPDGSVKWLLLDFQASVAANDKVTLQLDCDIAANTYGAFSLEAARLSISDDDDSYLVDTGVAQFVINKKRLGIFDQVMCGKRDLLSDMSSGVVLVDSLGDIAETTVSSIRISESKNTLRKVFCIDGFFQRKDNSKLADFNLKLVFYAGMSTVKCDFTLTNSQAAEHPGGVWDLGDKGSFVFRALSIKIQLAATDEKPKSSIRLSDAADWRLANSEKLLLEQHSSGGDNWQSKNHMNASGEVLLAYKGYRYFEKNVELANGSRATPVINVASDEGSITAYIVDFWQNFPKGIEVEQSTLLLNLFPQKDSESYELQGGERKRHTFYLDFSNDKNALDAYIADITPRIPLDYYYHAKVIPWLPKVFENSDIQKLIDRGISGKDNFFEKRETIDEYGWRNFGEIFADHEGLEYKSDEQLI
ncbi:MAG: hypothetical protein JKX75_01595, partial [Gammaproteobacteria bacterium]|nr:hypothetical protein [Gammaproteobacteria bacterium]